MTTQMHVTFNSKERTLREMSDIALSGGWQVTEVIRKPEGSLFSSIIAVPAQVPPSSLVKQEIIESSISPVGDTFYSNSRLPQSGSTVRRMTRRLKKMISKTFRQSEGSGEGESQQVLSA
jgi:hypothetical protein